MSYPLMGARNDKRLAHDAKPPAAGHGILAALILWDEMMDIEIRREPWPLRQPFHITGYSFHELEFVVVTLTDGARRGRGESAGVIYRDDLPPGIEQRLLAVAPQVRAGMDRATLQTVLPAGAARNALDCAYWELEAARAGRPVWQLAGLAQPKPLRTCFTIGIEAPGVVAERATGFADARAIKLKLGGDEGDADRVRAARAARPDVWLGVDANQGFTPDTLEALTPVLVEADVRLVEQPFKRGREADMDGLNHPLPMAADESVQDAGDLEALRGRFQLINIKLDKCGGLTHALHMAAEARRMGFGLMVGNMLGTSWSHAPAYLVGQLCDVVDLDGPTFFKTDRTPAVSYADGNITCGDEVWGGGT